MKYFTYLFTFSNCFISIRVGAELEPVLGTLHVRPKYTNPSDSVPIHGDQTVISDVLKIL